MSRALKRALSLLAALSILLLCAACGETPVEEEPIDYGTDLGDVLAETVAADNVFTLNCDYGSSFNPYISTSSINQMFMPLIYDSMFKLDGDFNLSSDYIEAWDSTDGLLWVFSLKTGYTLHNGHDLTASDLSYSVIQAMNSKLYKARMSDVIGVSASSADVLMISLSEPNMLFPYLLTIPIIEYGSVMEEVPPGCGPYYLTEERDRLLKFEDYRDADSMPMDVIYLADYSKAEDTIAAFENSLIDLVVNDKTGVFNLGFGRANETRYMDTTCMHYIGFNLEESYTQFTNHRVAMNFAVDRDYICSSVMDGCGVPAILPIHPNSPLYNKSFADQYEFSMTNLTAMLDNSQVTDIDMDGMREFMALGRMLEISLDFIVCSDSSLKVTVAKSIAENLKAVGIDVKVHALVWEDYMTALEEGDYDMYYAEVKLGADFDLSAILTEGDREAEDIKKRGGAINYGLKDGFGFDKYVDAYLAATDDGRQEAANMLCSYIMEQSPFVVICFEREEVITHRGVITGINAAQYSVFHNFANWKIDLENE